MNEKGDSTLVLRPSAALETTDPRAKRILSSMVADTLALATPQKIKPKLVAILDDEPSLTELYYPEVLRHFFSGLKILVFKEGDSAWRELQRLKPDLFITDVMHVGMKCDDMLEALARRQVTYPVLVISATLGGSNLKGKKDEWHAKAPNLNVSFIAKPFGLDEFLKPVEAALGLRAKPEL